MKTTQRKVVVRLVGEDYHSETAACPHCGAIGKLIVRFRCSDGQMYGAMKGCFSKFFYVPKEVRELARLENLLKKCPNWKKIEELISLQERVINQKYGGLA